jgi:hypothetical protein
MITKSYSKTGRACRVTFKIPAGQAEAQSIAVLGEFNGWNADAHPMEKRKDGSWSASVTMECGRPYRFRYLLDGNHWINDPEADSAVVNQFGSEDSVVAVEVQPAAAPVEKKVSLAKAAKPAAKAAKGNGKPVEKGAKTEKTQPVEEPKAAKTRKAGKKSAEKASS